MQYLHYTSFCLKKCTLDEMLPYMNAYICNVGMPPSLLTCVFWLIPGMSKRLKQ